MYCDVFIDRHFMGEYRSFGLGFQELVVVSLVCSEVCMNGLDQVVGGIGLRFYDEVEYGLRDGG